MDFNTWKEFYQWGFCTKEDLKQALEQEMLTKQQYDEILGIQEPTPVPTNKGESTEGAKPVDNTKSDNQENKPTAETENKPIQEPAAQQPIVNQEPAAQQVTTPSTTQQ